MFICGAYVWGADSPAYNVHTVDLFELLQDDINVYSNYGTVSVVGDLNCRVGVKADYIVLDEQIMDIVKRHRTIAPSLNISNVS